LIPGKRLYYAKKYRESIESFNTAIKLDPSFAEAYLHRGKSYIALALDRQGIQDLDRYIELDPYGNGIADAYALRGAIYGRNGNFEAAERDLKIAAEKGNEAAEKLLLDIARDNNLKKIEELRRYFEEMGANIGRKNQGSKDEDRFAEVLELTGEFGVDEIKRNYKKLAAQYHPDRVNHLGERLKTAAEKEMQEINEAYAYFRKKMGF